MTSPVTAARVLDYAGGAYGWLVQAGTPYMKGGLTLTREDFSMFVHFERRGAIVDGFWCKHYVECGPPEVLVAVGRDDKDKLDILLEIIERWGKRVCA